LTPESPGDHRTSSAARPVWDQGYAGIFLGTMPKPRREMSRKNALQNDVFYLFLHIISQTVGSPPSLHSSTLLRPEIHSLTSKTHTSRRPACALSPFFDARNLVTPLASGDTLTGRKFLTIAGAVMATYKRGRWLERLARCSSVHATCVIACLSNGAWYFCADIVLLLMPM
jgi:hypothetical protein